MAELNHSRLLIDEPPLQILPSLAVAIGLNEAIVLQQVQYWLVRKGHQREGYVWHYNSYPAWQKQFPFWSEKTIKRIFASLEERGLLVSGNYNDTAYDRTKWYRIDYDTLNKLVPSMRTNGPDPSGQIDPIDGDNLHPPIPRDYQENNQENNPPTPLTDSAFESFWAAFPGRRKVDKKKCATWWSRHVKPGDVEKVMAGLESWKASPDWKKNGGEYVPMPYTWLNNERWEVVIEAGDPHAGEPPTWDNTEPDKETNLKGWQMWNQDRMVGAKPGWRKYT